MDDETPNRRARRVPLADKLRVMPFAGYEASKAVSFRLANVVNDPRWGSKSTSANRSKAARLIGNALRFHWMRSEQQFQPRDYAALVGVFETHAPPLLNALRGVGKGPKANAMRYQLDVAGGERDWIEELEVLLERACRTLERIQQKRSDPQFRKAARSVGMLIRPAGHVYAYSMIEPFVQLSGREPSASSGSLFLQFVLAAEEALLARVASRMRRNNPSLTIEAALLEARERIGIKNPGSAVRWAVAEWRGAQLRQ